MSFRRAARVDDNQSDIVKLFRKLGWSVLIVSQLKNCCDIIVSKNGRTFCIEIKDGSKAKSAQKLSEGEAKFKDAWQGEYAIAICDEDVLQINKTV
mgnify:FL=1